MKQNINQTDLISKLKSLGFEAYPTKCSTYTEALIGFTKIATLYVLMRKNGIDFRYYDYIKSTHIISDGLLQMAGGIIVRNYYKKSSININLHALTIAEKFLSDTLSEKEMLTTYGKSNMIKEPKNDMQALYNELSVFRGEDVYLTDGIWIRSDGTMYDEKG